MDISTFFMNQDILESGKNLPREKYEPVTQIMIDVTRIKEGASSNTIEYFERVPNYHYYFKNYIEGIAIQPNPLENRRGNQDN